MNISMDKKYTLNGQPFTVLTVTKPGILPVVGYTQEGTVWSLQSNGLYVNLGIQLVEVMPYADFVIDEKVMVRDSDSGGWERRLFSGIDKINGLPQASFYTKWILAGANSTSWHQCRRLTAEELSE